MLKRDRRSKITASNRAATRRFIEAIDQGKRPRIQDQRVAAELLRPMIAAPKRRGPKRHGQLFFKTSDRSWRYRTMFAETLSYIQSGNSQSKAFALVAEQMDVSDDTVERVHKNISEAIRRFERDVISLPPTAGEAEYRKAMAKFLTWLNRKN